MTVGLIFSPQTIVSLDTHMCTNEFRENYAQKRIICTHTAHETRRESSKSTINAIRTQLTRVHPKNAIYYTPTTFGHIRRLQRLECAAV